MRTNKGAQARASFAMGLVYRVDGHQWEDLHTGKLPAGADFGEVSKGLEAHKTAGQAGRDLAGKLRRRPMLRQEVAAEAVARGLGGTVVFSRMTERADAVRIANAINKRLDGQFAHAYARENQEQSPIKALLSGKSNPWEVWVDYWPQRTSRAAVERAAKGLC